MPWCIETIWYWRIDMSAIETPSAETSSVETLAPAGAFLAEA